jgi:hypothetical protein
MKLAPLLWALSVWPLSLAAGAAESPAHNAASVTAAKGPAAAGITPRSAVRESTHAGSSKGDGSKGRHAALAVSPRRGSVTPPRTAGPLARGSADRLRSPHPTAQVPGRVASTPNRRVGPPAATGNVSARGQGLPGVGPQALRTPAVATGAVRAPPSVKAIARNSMIGGPRAAGSGRLGGPATGRTANNMAADGTQMHRKF